MTFTVSAFYKFARVEDCEALRADLAALGEREGLCGTILIAPEGINATIAGPNIGVRALLAHLRSDPRFSTPLTSTKPAGAPFVVNTKSSADAVQEQLRKLSASRPYRLRAGQHRVRNLIRRACHNPSSAARAFSKSRIQDSKFRFDARPGVWQS